MTGPTELNRLLSQVVWNARLSYVEGIDVFRNLLGSENEGKVLSFLIRALAMLEGKERGGIAYVIAEHYRMKGDLKKLQKLFVTEDADVKESVLDALQGEPGLNPLMGPGIVQMAVSAMQHDSPGVRTVACSVIQSQCAWGVEVGSAIPCLQDRLNDKIARVRHQASYAIGNLAKRRYNMSSAISDLRRNIKHDHMEVRVASAWALWQLSRSKHDITAALPELIWLMTDAQENNEHRKQAAGALLNHAKKSTENAIDVKDIARNADLPLEYKEVQRFVNELEAIE